MPVALRCGIRPVDVGAYTPADLAAVAEAEQERVDADLGFRALQTCAVAAALGQKLMPEDLLGPTWFERALKRERRRSGVGKHR